MSLADKLEAMAIILEHLGYDDRALDYYNLATMERMKANKATA